MYFNCTKSIYCHIFILKYRLPQCCFLFLSTRVSFDAPFHFFISSPVDQSHRLVLFKALLFSSLVTRLSSPLILIHWVIPHDFPVDGKRSGAVVSSLHSEMRVRFNSSILFSRRQFLLFIRDLNYRYQYPSHCYFVCSR